MFVEKSPKSIQNKLKASSISKLDNNAYIFVLSHPWRQKSSSSDMWRLPIVHGQIIGSRTFHQQFIKEKLVPQYWFQLLQVQG